MNDLQLKDAKQYREGKKDSLIAIYYFEKSEPGYLWLKVLEDGADWRRECSIAEKISKKEKQNFTRICYLNLSEEEIQQVKALT